MANSIRVAIFGNGFARRVMLPCLRHVDRVEVVGMASPNQERLRQTAEEFGVPVIAADHREVLERTRPDLVIVATPPDRHLEQSLDAIRSGCHVVCEKPTALSAEESRGMLEAAESAPGQLTLIDHELRFDPRRRKVKEWLTEGRLGTIRHATYTIFATGLRSTARPWTWWSDAARGGGALGALGSHAVDSLRSLLGEVVSVRGQLRTFVDQRTDPASGELRKVTADDFTTAWLQFASGAVATMTISLVEPERVHRMTIAGDKGGIRLDEQRPLEAEFGNGQHEEVHVADELPSNLELGLEDTDWSRNFLRLARRLVAAIDAGETSIDGAADFRDGHNNQLVLECHPPLERHRELGELPGGLGRGRGLPSE